MSRCRLILPVALLLSILSNSAQADSVFQTINPSLRAAWSYLRTENIDLALVELDGLKEKLFPSTDVNLSDGVAKALVLAEAGDTEKAGKALFVMRQTLRDRNTARNETLFEDCIWDANRLGDVLWPHIRNAPNFDDENLRKSIGASLAAYRSALHLCNETAPEVLRQNGEFRRLMDGTMPSLDIAVEAVQKADGALFYRYMIEIISFDRLLYFRFG